MAWSLAECVPPRFDALLTRNGYALLTDLDEPAYQEVILAMEGFQAAFLAATRPLWRRDFPIPGDALSHFSRQWEYPYAWANLGSSRGRVLDAGAGITFLPFLLSSAGFEVHCCDHDASLGLADLYRAASARTGLPVAYTECDLRELPGEEASFDAILCLSVLEHVGDARSGIVARLARLLRPGGRLVLTCDLDLRRRSGMLLEDLGTLLAELRGRFEPVFPIDLRRPRALLTSDAFLDSSQWRLPGPWQPPVGGSAVSADAPWTREFASIAVIGLTLRRTADDPEDAGGGA